MSQRFRNFYSSKLTVALKWDATTAMVSGSPQAFDEGEDFYLMTLFDGSTKSPEIVKVVGIGIGQLTLIRGQEGTTPQTWPIGTRVRMSITAGWLNNVLASVGGAVYTKAEIDALLADLPAGGASPRAAVPWSSKVGQSVTNLDRLTWFGQILRLDSRYEPLTLPSTPGDYSKFFIESDACCCFDAADVVDTGTGTGTTTGVEDNTPLDPGYVVTEAWNPPLISY